MEQRCVRIWLELGHACGPWRWLDAQSMTRDWRVWVRGLSRQDISPIVHKMVFHLQPAKAFVYPDRVLMEPQYEIQESGNTSIDIKIDMYLKHCTKPIKIKYSLKINRNSGSICYHYDIVNPSDKLKEILIKAGGEMLARVRTLNANKSKHFVLLSDTQNKRKRKSHSDAIDDTEKEKVTVTDITECKQYLETSLSAKVDFKKFLAPISMTDDEVETVSRVHLSFSAYEKSANALILPPISDPIYAIPELPVNLRGALSSVESDYWM